MSTEAPPQKQHPVPEMVTSDDVSPPRGVPFPIVGIGASAGGLEAFQQLLQALPVDTGMAFVLVQHLDPHHESELTNILSTATEMPVETVEDDVKVAPNQVYVLPPNSTMVLRGDGLHLTPRESGMYLPVDIFFNSLATEQGSRSIGVVLSGSASDGSQGVRAIKGECGVTFAQEEHSARFSGMPRNAIATGAVDFILSPVEIANELARIASHEFVKPPDSEEPGVEVLPDGDGNLKHLFKMLQAATGVDFTHYKKTTIRRRIGRRMIVNSLDTLPDYVAFAQQSPGELKDLYRDLLINVTSFFRDPSTFEALGEILSRSMAGGRSEFFRVWVPGCATGEELYSISILLHELLDEVGAARRLQLFGTDIIDLALERARAGIYPEIIAQDVSRERLDRFFKKVDSGYQIAKHIRETCVFARQDLTRDPPFSHLDLISCRNVLIYLDAAMQKRILPLFHYSLDSTGLLMLGDAEAVGTFTDLFEPADSKHKIYSRKGVPVRYTMDVHEGPRPLVVPVRASAPAALTGTELQKKVDRIFQHRYSPAAVVVDAEFQIVQFRGHTSGYLEPSPGQASLNLLRMAHEALVMPLRRALKSISERNAAISEKGFILDAEGVHREVEIEITPIAGATPRERHYLVVFKDLPDRGLAAAKTGITASEQNGSVQELQRDLVEAREQLRVLSDDHAAHLEELQAANEEICSANEELQSTNEELSTTKEELQSTNEELTTVNEELRNRNQQLSSMNSDLNNVLGTVNIPIVIVDNDLRIRRFTEASGKLFDFTPVDIGRPLMHVRGPFAGPNLEALVRTALDTLQAQQEDTQDQHGRWYSATVRPYRTLDNRIDGALIAFIDIDPLKRALQTAEQARDYAESLIETVREPLIVLDADLKVLRATKAFYENFQVSREETEGRFVYNLGNGQWNHPRLRELLTEALFRNAAFQDFEIEHDFPYIGKRTVRLNGRRLPVSGQEPPRVLLAAEDVTERKNAAELRYLRLFETAKDGIVVLDAGSGAITDVNPHFLELTGYRRDDLIGKSFTATFREAKELDRLLSEARAHEVARYDDLALRARDGRALSVEIVANVYLLGSWRVIQCNVRDITERKRDQTKLRETERRFRLFVESVQDYALFQMDPDGKIVTWNPGAERVLGYREDEIVGVSAAVLFTPEDVERGAPREELETARRVGRAEDERWHIRKDGTRFWASGVLTVVRNDDGRLRGFAKIMRDVTERKRGEEQLLAALREKEVLIKEIHHRVKNNLQVITSLLNLQASHIQDPSAKDSLEQTRNRVRAIATIHDLLYKSESLARVDMASHIQTLADDLRSLYGVSAEKVRVDIQVHQVQVPIEQAIPCSLIVNELVSNAFKYAFPGDRAGQVSILFDRVDAASYRLAVHDDGVGLPKDVNFRDTTSLGLQLINIFVEQLQGSIELIPNQGTHLEIVFPAETGSSNEAV